MTEEECLIGEAFHECRVSDNAGANDRGTTRDDEDPAINSVGGSEFEVVSLEIHTAKEVEERTEAQASWLPSHLLVGPDTADLGILKGSHDGGQEIEAGPEDVVVGQYCDLSLDVWNCGTDLTALTGDFCCENSQFGGRIAQLEFFDHGLASAFVGISNSNDDDCGRRVHQDTVKAPVKVCIERVDSWNNNRTVRSRIAWSSGNRSRPVYEQVGDNMHHQP